jgi:uncharacterized membrane protein
VISEAPLATNLFAHGLAFSYTGGIGFERPAGALVCECHSMRSFEIRVTIARPLATVFAVYTQPDTWRWCSYLRTVRWVRGRPWEEESRLHIEFDGPGGSVDQVLIRFEPDRRADFLSHFSGVTLESKVSFRPLPDDQTEINVQLEFVGVFSRIAGFAIDKAIERSTRLFFEDLKRACEQTPRAQAPLV